MRKSFSLLALAAVAVLLCNSVAVADYAADVLADNPVAFWPMHDPVTGQQSNAKNPSQPLTKAGTTLKAATVGSGGTTSVLFTATAGEKYYHPFEATHHPAGDYSVELWAYPTGSTGAWRSAITARTSAHPSRGGYTIYNTPSTHQWNVHLGCATAWCSMTADEDVLYNRWSHIVAVVKSKTVYLYVNAHLAASHSFASSTIPLNTIGETRVGAGESIGNDGYPWLGALANVAIYAHELTPERIYDHFVSCPTFAHVCREYSIDHSQGYAATVLADSPVAYWRMLDSTRAPHQRNLVDPTRMAVKRGSLTQSDAGHCSAETNGNVVFSAGSSNFYEVDFAPEHNPVDYTVEAYVFPTAGNTGVWKSVITSRYTPSGGIAGYTIYVDPSGKWNYHLGAGNTWAKQTFGTVALNQWYHVALTYKSSTKTASMYVNNVLLGSEVFSSYTINPNTFRTMRIGLGESVGSYAYGFVGSIAEVAVHNTVLTSFASRTNVVCTFPSVTPQPQAYGTRKYSVEVLEDGPTEYWRLNGPYELDFQENLGSAVNGNAAPPLYMVGSQGFSFMDATHQGSPPYSKDVNIANVLFPGSTATYMSTPYDEDRTPVIDITLEAWMFVTGGQGSWRSAITSRKHSPHTGFTLYASYSNFFMGMFGCGADWCTVESTTPITLNTWTHVVATHREGQFKVYVNGNLEKTEIYDGVVPLMSSGGEVRVGGGERPGQLDYMFHGALSDVAVYRHALSAERIKAHYLALPSDAPPTLQQLVFPPHVGSSYAAQILADAPTAFWRMLDPISGPQSNLANPNHPLTKAGTLDQATRGHCDAGTDGTVLFPGSTGNKYKHAFEPSHHPNTPEYSAEAWCYPTANNNVWRSAFTARSRSPYAGHTIYASPSNYWNIHLGCGATWCQVNSPIAVALNTWTHIAFTVDAAGTLTLYVNGVLSVRETFDPALTANRNQNGETRVGMGETTGGVDAWPWFGGIADVAIFPSALSPYRIYAHANSGDCVDSPTPVPTQSNPTPSPASCQGACLLNQCGAAGEIKEVRITGVDSRVVWGDGQYTDDSYVGAAAVHAGKLAIGETKVLEVRCAGTLPSFTGSEANGITSSAYAGSWSAFSFDLSGATPEPQAPAPEKCVNEPCAHNRCTVQGSELKLVVVGSTNGNAVWGYQMYTDDSNVGSAAVQMGLGSSGADISVVLTCTGAQSAFASHNANGVASQSFGYWQFSWTVAGGVPIPTNAVVSACEGPCLMGRCPAPATLRLRVTGSTYGYLWGTSIYTDDTTVGAAAVHSGLVSAGATQELLVTCTGAQTQYTGSTQNGVTTQSYGAWPASFSLSTAPPPQHILCNGACLNNLCRVSGQVLHITVTGSTGGSLWGTSIYTSDSDVGAAAVHTGLVSAGQSKDVTATCLGPQTSFEGSVANLVTSAPYGPWPASFSLQE